MALEKTPGVRKSGRLFLWLNLLPLALPAATVTVNAVGLSFNSNNLTIQVGDTVHWTNLSTGHNVAQSANAGSNAYDGSGFYSGPTCCSGPSTFDFTFNSAGDYFYICEAHAGAGMKGQVHVVLPSPTPTACMTPSPTASGTASPTATATVTGTDTPTPTPPPGSPTDSPTISPSASVTETPSVSPTSTDSPTATATATDSPSASATPSASQTFTPGPSITDSPTISPLPTGNAFAGVEDARLLASPITGGRLRLWARLSGQAGAAEVALYSAANNLIAVLPLGPVGRGEQRWTLALPPMASQPVWIQMRLHEDGSWRKGPVIRSYVLP